MTRLSRMANICVGWTAVIALACFVPLGAVRGQNPPKITQFAGVDNTKMGAYRALAELSFEAFRKGDNATAAKLARVLYFAWDRAEAYSPHEGLGDSYALGKVDPASFRKLQTAMNTFIKPIMHYADQTPDPVAVKAAFEDYLEELRLADCVGSACRH